MENSQTKPIYETVEKQAPPTINSIDHDITKIVQPDLLKIFDEELAADGNVKFSGKFSSRDEINLTSILNLENKQGPLFNANDEISILFRPRQTWHTHKFSIKGNKLTLHSDFGTYLLNMSFAGQNFDSWFNPYVSVDTNRLLHKPFISIGAYSVTPNYATKNSKITFYQNRHSIEADVVSNSTMSFGHYFINSLIASSLFTPFSTNERAVLLGADFGEAVAALKLEKNSPGTYLDWRMDNWRAMFAYAASAKHTLGVEIFKSIFVKNNLRIFFAYQFNNKNNLRFKCKIDNDMNTHLFTDYLLSSTLKVQLAAKTNLASLKKYGLLDNLPSIGLKFSLNR